MALLVGQDCGRIIYALLSSSKLPRLIEHRESGQFNEMQMAALIFYVSTTRPDIIGLGSKIEYAARYFLTHHSMFCSCIV